MDAPETLDPATRARAGGVGFHVRRCDRRCVVDTRGPRPYNHEDAHDETGILTTESHSG